MWNHLEDVFAVFFVFDGLKWKNKMLKKEVIINSFLAIKSSTKIHIQNTKYSIIHQLHIFTDGMAHIWWPNFELHIFHLGIQFTNYVPNHVLVNYWKNSILNKSKYQSPSNFQIFTVLGNWLEIPLQLKIFWAKNWYWL